MRGAKVATLVGLLCVITVTRIFVGNAGYGIAFYALIPIVLSAFWLGRRGALIIALTAAAIFVVTEFDLAVPDAGGRRTVGSDVNRSVIYLGVAVIVTALLERERQLRDRGHCCIERSAHSSWSHLPAQKPHGRARMPGLSWFSTGIVEPSLLL
ncbi:MAG: hypothetical protein ACRDTS_03210 [Mycobacterium sp.]